MTDVLVKIGFNTTKETTRQLISGLLNRSQFIAIKGLCIDFEDEDPGKEEAKEMVEEVIEVFSQLKVRLS